MDDTTSSLFEPWYWNYKIRLRSLKSTSGQWMQINGNIFLNFAVYKNNVHTENLIKYAQLDIYKEGTLDVQSDSKSSMSYIPEISSETVFIRHIISTEYFEILKELYYKKQNLDFDILILCSSLANSKGSEYYKTKEIWHLDKDSSLDIIDGIIFQDYKSSKDDCPENFDIHHAEWIKL